MFTIKIRAVAEPKVPELDAAFATAMGIASGDVAQLKADVRRNLAREVANRCKSKTKASVMDALNQKAGFSVPKALIESEAARMAENARADMAARGMKVKDIPIPPELFNDQAARRVTLGLLVGEIVKTEKLQATEDQVKALVQDMASAYEKPEDFVKWFMGQPKQRAEAEAVVLEDNVVAWALSKAKVTDHPMTVEGLMADGNAPQA